MDEKYIALNIGILFCLCGLDVIFVHSNVVNWFKHKTLYLFFPEWKMTKKLIWWFVFWTGLLCTNCILACMPFIFISYELSRVVLYVGVAYYPVIGLIYLIVKYNIRYRYDKKYEKVREARRQAMNEQKHYSDHDSSDWS